MIVNIKYAEIVIGGDKKKGYGSVTLHDSFRHDTFTQCPQCADTQCEKFNSTDGLSSQLINKTLLLYNNRCADK